MAWGWLRSPPAIVAMAVVGVLAIADASLVLRLNEGHFIYTLDDPYIHLALAEGLSHGHYGVSPGEPSSASSSIVWPFLLAPFAAFDWVPLAINLICSLVAALVLARLVRQILPHVESSRSRAFSLALVACLIPSTNVLGLAFMGMEHSLQLVLSLLAVLGLILEAESGGVPAWLPLVLVAGPLVRYENLALSAPVVLLLAWRGHRRVAIGIALGLAATMGSFSVYLHSLGLDWLPTSVVAKSVLVGAGSLHAIGKNVIQNLATRQGGMLSLLWLASIAAVIDARRRRAERGLAAWAACMMLGHLCLGAFGWYNRYEIYAWASGLLMTLYLLRGTLARFAERPAASFGIAVLLLILCFPYWHALYTLPVASNNIYEQQHQMHRFATEFQRGPVAVNDVGCVSYRNNQEVVDLWGIASRDALQDRLADRGDWMNRHASAAGANVAMIYDAWFPHRPSRWVALADLHLSRKLVTATQSTVTFYATSPEVQSEELNLLHRFAATLPRRVKLTYRGDEQGTQDPIPGSTGGL